MPNYGRLTQPRDFPGWAIREIREIKRQIAELRTARSLQAASVDVGSLDLFNNVQFKPGSIPNTALASPVIPLSGFSVVSSLDYPVQPGPGVVAASVVFTVPDACTRVSVYATVNAYGANSGPSDDWLMSWLHIDVAHDPSEADTSDAASANCPAGAFTMASTTLATTLTGLTSGDTLTVQSQPFSLLTAWSSNVSNSTGITANCLFLR